jgi:hypothetical protein
MHEAEAGWQRPTWLQIPEPRALCARARRVLPARAPGPQVAVEDDTVRAALAELNARYAGVLKVWLRHWGCGGARVQQQHSSKP